MSRDLYWKLSVAAISLAIFSPAFAEEKSYQLVYRFQSGQFFHYESDDKAEVLTQNANATDKEGRPLQSKSVQQTQLRKSFRVVAINENGNAVLEPIVEKVRMASQSGESVVISYDSTKGDAPPKEFEKIAGTIGRALARFEVAPNGKLLKVKLLVDDVPKNFSDAAERADPTINFLVVFPENPVKIGGQWSEKYDVPVSVGNGLTQQIKFIRTYELTKVVDTVVSIRFRTSLLTPTNDTEILRQLLQLTPTGTLDFDLQQGRMLKKTLHIDDKVVGAFGPQTLLQARGESVEQLLNPAAMNASNTTPGQQMK